MSRWQNAILILLPPLGVHKRKFTANIVTIAGTATGVIGGILSIGVQLRVTAAQGVVRHGREVTHLLHCGALVLLLDDR